MLREPGGNPVPALGPKVRKKPLWSAKKRLCVYISNDCKSRDTPVAWGLKLLYEVDTPS